MRRSDGSSPSDISFLVQQLHSGAIWTIELHTSPFPGERPAQDQALDRLARAVGTRYEEFSAPGYQAIRPLPGIKRYEFRVLLFELIGALGIGPVEIERRFGRSRYPVEADPRNTL